MHKNVLDKIPRSLPLKDAVKTSILSNEWRNKWVTYAQLDFFSEFFTSFNNNQVVKTHIYQEFIKDQYESLPLQDYPNIPLFDVLS